MGLREAENEVGDGEEAAATATATAVSCSICLEAVIAGGDRSTALLLCRHEFHLDCIGSTFNAKGVMECPNCRKVDKGTWLYANGSHSPTELSVDELISDDDPTSTGSIGMPYAVQWSTIGRSALTSSSFMERHSSPAVATHRLLGHGTNFTEHSATPAPDLYPYIPVLHPSQPFSYPNVLLPTENYIIGPGYGYNSNYMSRPTDAQTPHVLGSNNMHYYGLELRPQLYSSSGVYYDGANAVSVSGASRPMLDSDAPSVGGSVIHLHNHGCGSRTGASTSFVHSSVPPHVRAQGSVLEPYQDHNSQLANGSISTNMLQPSLPMQTGPFVQPPTALRGHNVAVDNTGRSRFHRVQYDHCFPFPHGAGASESNRSFLSCRHGGSERWLMPNRHESSARQFTPVPQMHF